MPAPIGIETRAGGPAKAAPRLAVVVSHPTQYYSPWFRWLREHTALELRVFYLWESGVRPTRDRLFGETFAWDVDLLSGYDHEFVPNVASDPGTHHFGGLRNPSLTARIREWGAQAILLFGYRYAAHLYLIAWARARGVPLLFRGDSHLIGRAKPSVAARIALGLTFAQFRAFLHVGAANHDYFRAFGVPESKLFFAPHSVDEGLFRPSDAHRAEASALRASLGLGGKRVVLFAGKFVPAKQPAQLLEAYLSRPRPGTAIVFVGDGSERPALEARAAASPGALVRFLPFANQSEMPSRYMLADLFVLPSSGSYETWGLAVNEAMHMGVPCMVSDRVGCQRDLVTPGETGWVFEAGDPGAMEATLSAALAELGSPGRLERMRESIGERIKGYSYARAAEGLLAALAALGA